jgi:hypothetical protein
MFYKISFSENVIRRRRCWLRVRQGALSGAVGLLMWTGMYTYVPKEMTIYALSREYSRVYCDIFPRDIALSASMPVISEFLWAAEPSCNLSHLAFLDALAADLKQMDVSVSGKIRCSSADRILRGEGGVAGHEFGGVNALFAGWIQEEEKAAQSGAERSKAWREDLLNAGYLTPSKTRAQQSADEQDRFLREQIYGFNNQLWQDEMSALVTAFPALRRPERNHFFLIDPDLTLTLLADGSGVKYQAKQVAWQKKADKRLSFRRRMNDELYDRVSALKRLESGLPPKQITQPLAARTEWLLNAATNFFTADELANGKSSERIAEIAGWAGFYRKLIITNQTPEKGEVLFTRIAFRIESPEQAEVPFSQYADFFRCLVNEPERFRILSIPLLEVEVKNSAAYVTRFRLDGEVPGVDPAALQKMSERMQEANLCFEDIRKVQNILERKSRGGGSDHGR